MTITNTVNSVVYTGNGTTTVFPYAFRVPDAASLNVELVEIASGATTVLSAVDYTVTGLGTADGGSVTYPKTGAAISEAFRLRIYRTVAQVQEVDITNQTRYDAEVVETVWDRLTMMIQDLGEKVGRTFQIARGDPQADDLVLGADVPSGQSLLGFTAGGDIATFSLSNFTSAQALVQTSTYYSGDGSTLSFTLPYEPGGSNGIDVIIDGLMQKANSYSVSGTTLLFTEAPPLGDDNIEVRVAVPTASVDNPQIAIKEEFATVALLLATSKGYGDFSAGDYLRVVEGNHIYKVAASGATDQDLTTTGGGSLKLYRVNNIVWVDQFGATGDGSTDDTAAIQAAVDVAKSAGAYVGFSNGSTYVIADTIWFGKDDAGVGVAGIIGNGCTIDYQFNDKPVFDLVGLNNGLKVRIEGFRALDTGGTYVPTCFFALGRPKQASGVKSSGNFYFEGNQIFGHFHVGCVYNVQSESNDWGPNQFFNYRSTGHAVAHTRHDYFEDLAVIDWDGASGTLTGSLTGGTSGATGTLVRLAVDLGGGAGRAWVKITSGTFADNETLTFGGGGTATANIPNGYVKLPAVSTNPTLGVEDDSTASLVTMGGGFQTNVANTDNPDASLFFSDWVAVAVGDGANLNHSNNDADLIHVQQDQTVNAGKSTGVNFLVKGAYLHAGHRNSIAFGDPVTGGGSYEFHIGKNTSVGTQSIMNARVKCIGLSSNVATVNSSTIHYDHGLDLTGTNCVGNNEFFCHEPPGGTYGAFTCDAGCEGVLSIDSSHKSRISTVPGSNRLRINYTDLLIEEGPNRRNKAISGGILTLDFGTHYRVTGSGTITLIRLPEGVRPYGPIFLTAQTAASVDLATGGTSTSTDVKISVAATVTIPQNKPVMLIHDSITDSFSVFEPS